MKLDADYTRKLESEQVLKNLPNIQRLLRSKKISKAEKLSVLEDVNVDLEAYLAGLED